MIEVHWLVWACLGFVVMYYRLRAAMLGLAGVLLATIVVETCP